MSDWTRGKSPIAIVAAYENMLIAKSYDIRKAISCDVAKEAEVAIQAPTSIIAEVVESEGRRSGKQRLIHLQIRRLEYRLGSECAYLRASPQRCRRNR
jgi:hypothetical protein